MVIEIARFQVAPDKQKGFFDAFADVKAYVEKAEGYQSHIIGQEVEDPSHISLMVEWRSYKDHVELFEPSEEHEIFINALMPFFEGEVEVFHFNKGSASIGGGE